VGTGERQEDTEDQADEGAHLETGEVGSGGRMRSTRHRPDVPDLPPRKMAPTTLGRIYVDERTGVSGVKG
jgi:hypothetical protein